MYVWDVMYTSMYMYVWCVYINNYVCTHMYIRPCVSHYAESLPGLRLRKSQRVHVPKVVYTLGPMYLCREYFRAKAYTIWVHGPLGNDWDLNLKP